MLNGCVLNGTSTKPQRYRLPPVLGFFFWWLSCDGIRCWSIYKTFGRSSRTMNAAPTTFCIPSKTSLFWQLFSLSVADLQLSSHIYKLYILYRLYILYIRYIHSHAARRMLRHLIRPPFASNRLLRQGKPEAIASGAVLMPAGCADKVADFTASMNSRTA